MKIHGRNLDDVYRMLPVQFRALIIISAAFVLFTVIYLAQLLLRHDSRDDPGPLGFGGSELYSAYDPALASSGENALLAFSHLQIVPNGGGKYAPGILIARAAAPCKKWRLLPVAAPFFAPVPDTLTAPDGTTTIAAGAWRYETPGVVFDPGDPGREWKLFASKYMWSNDANLSVARRYSFIVLRTAGDPAAAWSTEEAVFGAKEDWPPPPYSNLVETRLDTLDPALSDVITYTRPSVVNAGGTLVMSLSAFTADAHPAPRKPAPGPAEKSGKAGTLAPAMPDLSLSAARARPEPVTPDRIVMIASDDHGKTWRYLGSPLSWTDAAKTGPYTTLGGATLLKKGGRIYLAAVFGDEKTSGLGTFIFGFSDITKGLLNRDEKTGAPVLLRHFPRFSLEPSETGGGFAAWDDACTATGMLTGEYSGLTRAFHIFKTKKRPDEEP